MPRNTATRIVRAPWPVRARMRVLERVAPRRAARLAEALWFRVPPAPSAHRLNRFTPPGGAPFFLMAGPAEVKGETFGCDRARVDAGAPLAFLVHGWGGYWQQLAAHVPALVEAGYRVVAWDAPGHSGSTHGGEGAGSGSVLEMADAFDAVADEFGEPALVVCHSIGAMAALRAQRSRRTSDAYLLIAPQLRLEPALAWFEQVVSMGPRTRCPAGAVPSSEKCQWPELGSWPCSHR